jgi:large subunit ribosomal protein L17
MRHKKRGRQLGRDTQHRRALYRNLVTSLFDAERIETTEPKGKEIRSIADKMITLAKSGTLADRRRAAAYVMRAEIVKKLFDEIAPRFAAVNGGYTRLVKTRVRRGDGAPMVLIELSHASAAKSEGQQPAEGRAAKSKTAEGAA